jgi:hypothetical protein
MKNPLKKSLDSRPKKNGPAQQAIGMDTGTGPQPDYRRMQMTIGGDAKGHALNKLLTSDASNAIKSSNANPFNLSVMDVMGHWEECESEEEIIQFFLNGRNDQGFEGGYRVNKMAEDFKMTTGYIEGFKAWTLIGGQVNPPAPAQLNEGDKKK